ncbi:BNR repeat-containing protein [Sphaerisporangium dianthi]|uniref:BNR repeat-containing protein n=1 Tax=Sphaerisporangium dianthi TaxID=1436120 RepID=A0ABV9CBT3_9ACTN
MPRRPAVRLLPRFIALALLAVAGAVAGPAPGARAAAPTVTPRATTLLTSNGNPALTYTGYMNGESFQQEGITSYRGWQYAVFWDSASHVNIARRQLPSGGWQILTLTDYTTTSTDSHNVISLGISRADGTIHLAFDMHSSTLHYRRSVTGLANDPARFPWTAASFGPPQTQLTGPTVTTVTYPAFIDAPGDRLQLTLRTGMSGAGNQVLYEYAGGAWTYLGQFLDGVTRDQNAYLFGIEYDRAGRLHMTWTWRETSNAATNHDLMYAYSADLGRTWRNNSGAVIATTGATSITSGSPGVRVWSIGQNRGLINQESQVVDSTGVVHVLASHLPANAPSQSDFTTARESAVLVHYYRDVSGGWHQTYTPFLERSSRGDIGVDSGDDLYVVSGDSKTHKLHIQTASKASGWSDWALRYTSAAIYYSDPLLDHAHLRDDDLLTIFAPQYGGRKIDIQDWATGP